MVASLEILFHVIYYPSLHRKIFVRCQTTFYPHHRFRWKYPLELHNSMVFPSTNLTVLSYFFVVAAHQIWLRVVVARLANNTHPHSKKWTPVHENPTSPWQCPWTNKRQQPHLCSEQTRRPSPLVRHVLPPPLSHIKLSTRLPPLTTPENTPQNGTATWTPSRASLPGSQPLITTNISTVPSICYLA